MRSSDNKKNISAYRPHQYRWHKAHTHTHTYAVINYFFNCVGASFNRQYSRVKRFMVVTSPPGRRRAQLQLGHTEYANKSHTPICTSVDDISFFVLRSFSASRSNATKYTAWHDVVSTKSEIQRLAVTRAPRLFIKQMQTKNIKFPAIKLNTKCIATEYRHRQRQLNHFFAFGVQTYSYYRSSLRSWCILLQFAYVRNGEKICFKFKK